jgi:biopolymer transport protein TolR
MTARAEINVTPLIDVMLVLLILFMLVTPVAPRGLEGRVPDPAPSKPEAPARSSTPLVVTVEETSFQLNQAPVLTASELEAQLREILVARTDRTVFVRAVGPVKSGRVVEAMDVARGAGAERIGIVLPE